MKGARMERKGKGRKEAGEREEGRKGGRKAGRKEDNLCEIGHY